MCLKVATTVDRDAGCCNGAVGVLCLCRPARFRELSREGTLGIIGSYVWHCNHLSTTPADQIVCSEKVICACFTFLSFHPAFSILHLYWKFWLNCVLLEYMNFNSWLNWKTNLSCNNSIPIHWSFLFPSSYLIYPHLF